MISLYGIMSIMHLLDHDADVDEEDLRGEPGYNDNEG